MKVIVDLVPNHTSDEHVWFQEALASAPGSHERDRYMFRHGRDVVAGTGDGNLAHNNCKSWVEPAERLARNVRKDKRQQAFNFDFLLAGWDAERIAAADEQPHAALGLARARPAAMVSLALPGSAYIYQGEELGLPEHTTLPDEARQDPTFFRTKGVEVGRDGCRVPLPWHADEPGYGFAEIFNDGDGHNAEGPAAPWLPNYRRIVRPI